MNDWLEQRSNRLREFFGLNADRNLISSQQDPHIELTESVAAHLAQFNLEWHVIPSEDAVSVEHELYRERLYPTVRLDPELYDYRRTSSYKAVIGGHRRHQGRI